MPPRGNTALHWAADKGQDGVAQRLLTAGAAVDAESEGGQIFLSCFEKSYLKMLKAGNFFFVGG